MSRSSCARLTAVTTSGGAPEISSGRSRLALSSYFCLDLARLGARHHAEDVVPGYAGPQYAGLHGASEITPRGQEAAPASPAGRWKGRAGYMMTSTR